MQAALFQPRSRPQVAHQQHTAARRLPRRGVAVKIERPIAPLHGLGLRQQGTAARIRQDRSSNERRFTVPAPRVAVAG